MARIFKLTLAYDGSDFAGWQRQANDRTVQAVLEDALAPIEKTPVTVMAAGRTDAGVHAAGQVAGVRLESAISSQELLRALNATLPYDVRVLAIEDAAPGFSARRDARRKTYHYWIWNGVIMPPIWRRFAWHVPQSMDLAAMNEAASLLVGEHDFAAFQGSGSGVKTTVRRILSSTVRHLDLSDVASQPAGDRLLRYEVTGTGFLRHMVRNIVGTLADVARQRSAASDVSRILSARDRTQASATAPAHGLVLWQVEY